MLCAQNSYIKKKHPSAKPKLYIRTVKERHWCCIFFFPHEIFFECSILTLASMETGVKQRLESWCNWGVDKVPKHQDFWLKRMHVLGCLGTFVLALWYCHTLETVDGKSFENYKFIFSANIMLRSILHVQTYLWNWGFVIFCRGELNSWPTSTIFPSRSIFDDCFTDTDYFLK